MSLGKRTLDKARLGRTFLDVFTGDKRRLRYCLTETTCDAITMNIVQRLKWEDEFENFVQFSLWKMKACSKRDGGRGSRWSSIPVIITKKWRS